MSFAVEVVGNILILLGVALIISTLVGVKRFDDNLSKIHAVGISDIVAYPLCYTGLFLQNLDAQFSYKYIFLILILFATSPLVSHNIAKIIYDSNNKEKKQ
jgi:multicomponent Na+:H+ antiporter subunit G